MVRHPGSRGLFELPAIAERDAGWLGESDDREVTLSTLSTLEPVSVRHSRARSPPTCRVASLQVLLVAAWLGVFVALDRWVQRPASIVVSHRMQKAPFPEIVRWHCFLAWAFSCVVGPGFVRGKPRS